MLVEGGEFRWFKPAPKSIDNSWIVLSSQDKANLTMYPHASPQGVWLAALATQFENVH